jgi:hypothetical protein
MMVFFSSLAAFTPDSESSPSNPATKTENISSGRELVENAWASQQLL